jgi:hypothetical protein
MVCFPQGAPMTLAGTLAHREPMPPKTLPLADLKSIRGRVLHLYTTIGEMTDAECHEMYEAQFGRILRSSIIARRVELVRDGYIDDTGHTIESDDPNSNVQCTRWSLATNVPADVRMLNRLKRSTPREALDFALDLVPHGECRAFLRAWRGKAWDLIRQTWPSFAAPVKRLP